jgi:branched-chain amino acid transport system substrate-binding protein
MAFWKSLASRVVVTGTVVLAAAVLIAAPPASSASAKSTIVLGDIGTDSGPVGTSLIPVKSAAIAWEDYVNAHGGLNGHPVKIIFGDDAGSVATALSLATTMVKSDHIVAMFGLHSENAEAAILKYLGQNHVPAIAGKVGVLADEQSSAMYNPSTSATANTYDQVLLVKKLFPSIKKIAIIYCPASESVDCQTEDQQMVSYAPSIGMKIVYNGTASLTAPNYTAQIVAAKAAGAEAIIPLESQAGTLGIIQDAAQQNWYPAVEGNTTIYTSTFNPGSTLPAKAKLIDFSNTPPYSLSPLMKSYVAAVKKYQPGTPLGGNGGTVTWTGGALLQQVAKQFGANVTGATVTKGLLALKGATLGGLTPPLTFPKSANRTWVNSCVVPIVYKNAKWVAPLGSNSYVCAKKP